MTVSDTGRENSPTAPSDPNPMSGSKAQPGVHFELLQTDGQTAARRGRLTTAHGTVELPAFMPVGTQGTVKGLTPEMLRETGTQMILANTYHLALRPGEEVIERLGGLQQFTGWNGPILTDSGGFQVFSLADQVRVSEQGVVFRSHIDGTRLELTPERAMEIQAALGSDIAMVLDHVVALPSPPDLIVEACRRSVRWAERCRDAASPPHQVRFAIVQGGLDVDLRLWCSRELVSLGFPGYAIGGLSVGEPPDEMYAILRETVSALPADRPRYLMGVGRPEDILEAISHGVDMFDCVLPTRNGRNALAFTDAGPIKLRNACYADDPRPLDETCPSPASAFSRAFLRHLFLAKEMLGPILVSAHNVAYYQKLMRESREAIEAGRFGEFREEKQRRWQGG